MEENKVVGYSWVIFSLVLLIRTIVTGLGWTCVAPFFTTIAAEMKLSSMQIGMAWGMITLGALFFSLLGGLISDRIGVRWAGFIGLLLAAFGGAMRGFAADYAGFLAAMFIFGMALGLAGPNYPRALSQWFPSERLGMVNGITMAGFGFGGALAMAISVSLLSPLVGGWRNVMFLFSILTLGLAGCWVLLMRERIIGERFAPTAKMVIQGLAYVLRLKPVWSLAVINLLLMGHFLAWSGLMPGFFENKYGMTRAMAGQILSIALFFAIVAQVLGPTLSDRFGLRKPVLLAACVVGGFFNLIQGSFVGTPLIIIMILIPFGLGTIIPLVMTVPFELKELPQVMAGAAIGLIITFGNFGGFIYPIFAGKIIDVFKPNYYPFFVLQMAAFGVIFLLIWRLLPETGPKAQKAIRGQHEVPGADLTLPS